MLVIDWCRGVAKTGTVGAVALRSKVLKETTEPWFLWYFTTHLPGLHKGTWHHCYSTGLVHEIAHSCRKLSSAWPAIRHVWLSLTGMQNHDHVEQYLKILYSMTHWLLWGLLCPFYLSWSFSSETVDVGVCSLFQCAVCKDIHVISSCSFPTNFWIYCPLLNLKDDCEIWTRINEECLFGLKYS